MSNIDTLALREAAEEEIMLRTASDTSDNWQDLATPEAMLALLDEREADKKRIAELEAREIKPAKGEVLVVVSGFTGCGKAPLPGK